MSIFQQKLVWPLHRFPQHHYAHFHFDYTFFVVCMTNGVLIRPADNTHTQRAHGERKAEVRVEKQFLSPFEKLLQSCKP